MITLISCCKEKLADKFSLASEMYKSQFFNKAKVYAARRGEWYILSAFYGILRPDEIARPYNLRLASMSSQERNRWALFVYRKMETMGIAGLRFVSLAGKLYNTPLLALGLDIETPIDRLGIGKQLKWLDDENKKPLSV